MASMSSSQSSEWLFFGPMSNVPSNSYLEEKFAHLGSDHIKAFFKKLKDCPRLLSVRILCLDIFCEDEEPGFKVWKDSGSRPAPKSKIQINWEHDQELAFWRVLEVLELLKESDVHLKQGSWERRGDQMQIDLIIVNADGRPIKESKAEKLREMITSSERPPQILDPSTQYCIPTISSVVVAGPDTFGILRDITKELALKEFNIVATTLRTQNGWFAGIFHVNSCHRRELTQREMLHKVQKALEDEHRKLMVEIFFHEEVPVPEMWLNWEFSQRLDLSQEATTMPALPNNVVVTVAPQEAHTVNVQILSQDDGYAVFDTLCTLHFIGYSIIGGSFISTYTNDTGNRQVEQKLHLDAPISKRADISRHLALAFSRRQTQGTKFTIQSADKPGQLHDWASIFHDGWWEVKGADVEVVDKLAKTMVYASPKSSRLSSDVLKEKLEGKGFRVVVSN